jgi:hypothetical protein
MGSWHLQNIGSVASNLAELEELDVEEQALLLLRYLVTTNKVQCPANLRGPYMDQFLGSAFPVVDRFRAVDLLLAAPWQYLLQQGWTSSYGNEFVIVTQAGQEVAKTTPGTDQAILRQILPCLKLLHPDLRGYSNYFRTRKYKVAVAAAFERYENKLNEARDGSRKRSVRGAIGGDLVYALYNEKVLKRPYAKLGSTPTKKEALHKAFTGFLSGAIGWIRNPYTHEKHHLPDICAEEALELLFVASYLMHMIDKSKKNR